MTDLPAHARWDGLTYGPGEVAGYAISAAGGDSMSWRDHHDLAIVKHRSPLVPVRHVRSPRSSVQMNGKDSASISQLRFRRSRRM